jgi:predicted nucleic acid-binding Zn ribbon protein
VRRRDDLVSLGEAVAAVAEGLGMPPPASLTALIEAWPEIVGAALAAHVHVRSVRDGVCTIEVDGPVWATQLRYLGDDLLARVRERLGPGVVTSVRVVVAGPRTAR